jgi:hypothetical protein
MRTTRTITTATLLSLVVAGELRAQGGEFVIQGYFNPTIADARKLEIRPQHLDTILPPMPVDYRMLGVRADIPAKVDSIAPAKLNILPPQPRLYRGYAKAGFGLYTTPLGELYYNKDRSRNNAWGLHAKHFSSNGGLDDVGPSDYSFNSVDGHYTQFLRTHEVSGRLMYDRRRISYYGYTPTDSIRELIDAGTVFEDQQKQVYNDIGFAARIRSLFKDSTKVAHDVGVEAHSFSNLTGSRESHVRIGADLGMVQGSETYSLGVLIDNNAYKGFVGGAFGELRINGTLIGLRPAVSTAGDRYRVRVGANLYVDALGRTSFHFFPNAYASYSLFDDILVPYVGLEGDRHRNTLRGFARENPFIAGVLRDLRNSSTLYDLYGGIRGSFSSRLAFDGRVTVKRVADMPLYVNTPNPPVGDRMDVVYDRVDIFTVGGELRYHVRRTTDVTARLDVNSYDTRRQSEAWNLPAYELAIGARHDLREKIIVKAEALFLGRRPVRGDEIIIGGIPRGSVFGTEELPGFVDLYLGLEYRYTKRLSVFLDMSNLSASKYERWFRYPVQRGLLVGGATYAF